MKRKTTEEFILELNTKFPNQYEVLSEYINAKTKVKIKHIKCGNIWEITPSNILHGYSCPICNGGSLRTKESFEKIINKLYPNEYNIIGEYKDARTKIKIEHIKCGFIYEVTPDNLKRGKGCPHCNLVKSQKIFEIEEFLINLKVPFQLEKTFEDLIGDARSLRFDICIYKNGFDNFMLIEFDGIQHADKNNPWHNEKLIEYDNKKTNYCISNNLLLKRYNYKTSSDEIKNDIIKFLK